MRWSIHSWRWQADRPAPVVDDRPRQWAHSAAAMALARLDLAYRAADGLVGEVPPVVFLTVQGEVELWWPTPRDVSAPFVASDRCRWMLSCDVDLVELAGIARCGRLHLDRVTQVGIGVDRRVILVDLGHWTHLDVDTDPDGAGPIIHALEAGFGLPPLTCPPRFEESQQALLGVGRSGEGLWLSQHHHMWILEPLGLWLTPVGVEGIDLPDTSGEPEQRSTS